MLGVSIGPLQHPFYRWLACLAANLADLICVRDTDSDQLLKAIGVRRPIHVTADPVFTMTANGHQPLNSPEAPFAVVVPHNSLLPTEQTALAAACDHLVETYGLQILFVPFQASNLVESDDLATANAVHGHMRFIEAAQVWTDGVTDPAATLALIGRAELVLSARLHALIFAALQGVASVAISYEVKIESFMKELGRPWAQLSLPDLVSGQLPAMLDRAWTKRLDRQANTGQRVAELRAAAQRNFDLARKEAAQPHGQALLAGSAILFASMTIVNAGNYLFNLILGRWLGPAAFADLSLIVTLFLIVTFVTSTLQLIAAKFSAVYSTSGNQVRLAGLRHWLGGWAWVIGAGLLILVSLGAPLWMEFFQTQSLWPFILFAIGIPIYFAQGVDRGILQGQIRFGVLALSYQAEMWVRLIIAMILVGLGWSVNGAVVGLTVSFGAAWLVARKAGVGLPRCEPFDLSERRTAIAFAGPVSAALVGQILINNSDILIVKHFFAPEPAGQYAALALIGRIVFFATWSVVTTLFPIVAQKQQKGEPHRHLLGVSLGLVAGVSAIIIAASLIVPELIVNVLFGSAYFSIAPLLWLYAIATTLYALANVVINYRLSAGNGGGSWLAVGGGLAQVIGLWFFHADLQQVVMTQIYVMVGLLGLLLAWDTWIQYHDGPKNIAMNNGK
jgi:O-antigen/teichoic acid export membrane protein